MPTRRHSITAHFCMDAFKAESPLPAVNDAQAIMLGGHTVSPVQ
jgi:hypothetical protein